MVPGKTSKVEVTSSPRHSLSPLRTSPIKTRQSGEWGRDWGGERQRAKRKEEEEQHFSWKWFPSVSLVQRHKEEGGEITLWACTYSQDVSVAVGMTDWMDSRAETETKQSVVFSGSWTFRSINLIVWFLASRFLVKGNLLHEREPVVFVVVAAVVVSVVFFIPSQKGGGGRKRRETKKRDEEQWGKLVRRRIRKTMAALAELIACRYCRLAVRRVARVAQYVPRSLPSSSLSKGLRQFPRFLFWIWRPAFGRRESPSFVDGLAVGSAERCTSSTPTTHWTRSSPTCTVEVGCCFSKVVVVVAAAFRVVGFNPEFMWVMFSLCFLLDLTSISQLAQCSRVRFITLLLLCVYVINSLSLSLVDWSTQCYAASVSAKWRRRTMTSKRSRAYSKR